MGMIIGFDAKRAANNYTGLGNYSRYVIEALARHCPEHKYRLYVAADTTEPAYEKLQVPDCVTSVLPDTVYGGYYKSLWRSWFIKNQLRRQGVDLFHGLSNEIPLGLRGTGVASVVTIHDVIFLHYPQFYKPIDRAIYNAKFGYACRKANRVVAVSECTKRDIVRFYKINPDKVDVIYQGCDPIFAADVPDSELARVRMAYDLPRQFILNVGTVEQRKNVLLAIKALPQIDPQFHLVVVGRKTPYMNEITKYIRDNDLVHRVHFIHDMAHPDLPVIYRLARAFVFPSRYEGFGIPIVEALTSGVPVIAATGSCLEEAGGPTSIYVDPDDVDGMAQALQRVLTDPELRDKMIAAGREYVARFDSAIMADAMMETYRKALEEQRKG